MTVHIRIRGQLTPITISWGLTLDTVEVRVGDRCYVFEKTTSLAEVVKSLEEGLV